MNARYKFIVAVVLLSLPFTAFAANPAYVGTTPGAYNSPNGRTPSCGCATDDFIIMLLTSGGAPASPIVSDTEGTVITDVAFSGSIGIYRVHNAAHISHRISVSWGTAPTDYYLTIIEASGIGGLDGAAGTPAVNSGRSVNPTTDALTANSGDLLLAATTSGLYQSSGYTTWTNGFTGAGSDKSGPSWAVAYLNSAAAGSINTQTTIATSTSWNALLVAYEGATTGFLAVNHWVAAKLPMTVIFPRPDSETTNYARPHWFYYDGSHPTEGIIPIEVQGGAYPYVFTLLSGPPGMTIGQSYWIPGDTPDVMLADGYGDIEWTPTAAWTGKVSVLVTGQDRNSVTVSFTASTIGTYSRAAATANVTTSTTTPTTITVNSVGPGTLVYGMVLTGADIPTGAYIVGQTSGTTGGAGQYTLSQGATAAVTESVTGAFANGFLFADASVTGAGTGTITNPFGNTSTGSTPNDTLQNIYGLTYNAVTPYVGALLYLRGNSSSANYEAYDQTGQCGIDVNGNKNPQAIMAYPGDPTPNIDITNLAWLCSGVQSADHVVGTGATSSDAYFEGFSFSGIPNTKSPAFEYFVDNQTANNRVTFYNISAPNIWIGSNPARSTSGLIVFDKAGTGTANRNYFVIKGVSVSNIDFTQAGVGCVHVLYNITYGITEFSSCLNSTGAVGFLVKDNNSYYTRRYNLSTGDFYPLEADGFLEPANPTNNTYIETAYNYTVSTESAAGQPLIAYELSDTNGFGNVYDYRNTVDNGAEGVAQDTNYTGSYAFQADAIEFGTAWTQGIVSDVAGTGWQNTPLTSLPNVTDANSGGPPSGCEVASGVLTTATYPQLTGACLSLIGQIGAGIQ